jgi:iron complex outermembrane recepter protein
MTRMISSGTAIAAVIVASSLAARVSGAAEAAATSGQSLAPGNANVEAPRLEEVLVTASKRTEAEVNVPSSISVLSATALQDRGVQQFADYAKTIPGISTINAAAPGHGQIVIRGITTGANQSAPTTGVYLDDIPFTTTSPLAAAGASTFDPDLADINHIEVLKGPQSTLYGASAMGGIVKVVTEKPSLTDFSGNATVRGGFTDGGDASYGVRGAVNLPLVDGMVALRLAAFERHDGGFVDNVYTGSNDINHSNSSGGRGSLLVKFSDAIETTFSILYQDLHGGGFAFEYLNQNTLAPLYGERKISAYYNNEFETIYKSVGNTTTADLGFATFTNSLSYINTRDDLLRDYSSAYGVLLGASRPADAAIHYNAQPSTNRITEEARLSSKGEGPFEWLAGVFYTNERDHYGSYLRGLHGTTGEPLPPPQYNFYTFDEIPRFKEWALFADLTYHFTEQVEATVGMRHSSNKQSFEVDRSGLLGATPIAPGSSSDSANTYLATVSYHPDQNSTLYARAASAYQPGSTQVVANSSIPAVYGPSMLWNYELGYKGSWLDGRLSTESSVYHINWSRIQLNSIINGFTVISNAGDAKVDGVEVNLSYAPMAGLKLGGNANYNKARLVTNNAAIGAVDGDPLPLAPKVVANAFAEYSQAITSDVLGRAGLDFTYQGSRYTSFSKDPLNTSYHLPSFAMLGLHAGADWSRYNFDLRLDNLTNRIGITSVQVVRVLPTQQVPAWATISRPRTVTASVSVKF